MSQQLTPELFELKKIEPRMNFDRISRRKSGGRDRCHRREVVLRFGYSCDVENDAMRTLRGECDALTSLHYDALVAAGTIDDDGNFEGGHVGHSHMSVSIDNGYPCQEGGHPGNVSLIMRWDAERECDIISEAVAHEIFAPIMGALIDAVHVAWAKVVELTIEGCEHEQRVKHANHTLRHLAEQARARARKIVRVVQRRAAIDAEYEAEKLAQVDAILAELDKTDDGPLTFEDGTAVDVRSLAAARAALREVVAKKESRFGRHDEYTVKAEDVE